MKRTGFAAILLSLCAFGFSLSGCGSLPEKEQKGYDEALAVAQNYFEMEDWVPLSVHYGWGSETSDQHDQYHFYAEKSRQGELEPLVLKGISDAQISHLSEQNKSRLERARFLMQPDIDIDISGNEKELEQEFPFRCLNIYALEYESDTTYMDMMLEANRTYYLVQYYPHAFCARYRAHPEDEDGYITGGFELWPEEAQAILVWKEKGDWNCFKPE